MKDAAMLATSIVALLFGGWSVAYFVRTNRSIAALQASRQRLATTALERGVLLDRIRALEGMTDKTEENYTRLRLLQASCGEDVWMHELLETRLYEIEWRFIQHDRLLNPVETESDLRRAHRFIQESRKQECFARIRSDLAARVTASGKAPPSPKSGA